MATMTLLTTLVCAHVTLAANNVSVRTPLHDHPTLVSMLDRNNDLRNSAGLREQKMSPELTRAAQEHADYLARTGSFSHYVNGSPASRAKKHHYRGSVRENIAMGYGTIGKAFSAWRNSGGHWANITCSAPEAGFGYAVSSGGTAYWVGLYGFPADADSK